MNYDCIPVNRDTARMVQFAARMAGVSESAIVERAVQAFTGPDKPKPPPDPWEPVPIYGEYDGHRVEGDFLRATKRLTVRSGALSDQVFTSPSGAARAVVAALNPSRNDTPINGWRFWRLAATHDRLNVLR